MSQPAKVQEPSMEEILASIRRIIADDETKPATSEGIAAPTPKSEPAAVKPAPTIAIAPVKTAPAPVQAPPPKPAAAESNSQDDIDALLAGLDASTTDAEVRAPAPVEDVLDLTDDMALPDMSQPGFRKVEPESDLEFTETASHTDRVDPPPAPERRVVAEQVPFAEAVASASPQILSHSTVSAVESAFNTLAHTVLSNNARTLEDLVREMLRPMLKSWLDDNLPSLVERIVKAEIERVSRGR